MYIDQFRAGQLFEQFAALNGITGVKVHVRTQRENRDFYYIPGMPFQANSWLVYEKAGDSGTEKNEVALSLIKQAIEQGWDGQPDAELTTLKEFYGKPAGTHLVRWKQFIEAMSL